MVRAVTLLSLLTIPLLSCAPAGDGGGGPNEGVVDYVAWRYPGGEARPTTLAFITPTEPGKGQAIVDPVFHTRIRRVTDRATDGYPSPGIQNEYSRADPENADGTRALLRGSDGDWHLYGVPGFERLRGVGFRGNPDPEPRWHPTDPDLVWFVEGPSLWLTDVTTGAETLIHDFSTDDPRCGIVRTRYEGEPSANGRIWCLRLEDPSYELLSVVCYDRQADAVIGILPNPPTDNDHVSMDLSGEHCIVPSDEGASYSYSRDFARSVRLPDGIGHADVGLDVGGRDVLVYQNNRDDTIAMVDLATGQNTPLIPIPFPDNVDIGLHISCNCDAAPGWALVSTYGSTTTARSWMDRCLFMLELRANPAVWRIAQTQTLQASSAPDYFGEAFAAVNGAGSRVWWGSNWNQIGPEGSGYEAYIVELPPGWPAAVRQASGGG